MGPLTAPAPGSHSHSWLRAQPWVLPPPSFVQGPVHYFPAQDPWAQGMGWIQAAPVQKGMEQWDLEQGRTFGMQHHTKGNTRPVLLGYPSLYTHVTWFKAKDQSTKEVMCHNSHSSSHKSLLRVSF